MKFITKTILAAAVATGMAWQANAHLVNPDGLLVVGSNDSQQVGGVADQYNTLHDPDLNLTQLWSWDQGGGLSGNGFNVVFSADSLKATLSWNLTGTGNQLYAVGWKDGTLIDGYSSNLGYYWSEVTEGQRLVSDGDTIRLTVDLSPDFKNPTAWSHIAFYGTEGTVPPPASVPDGGTTLAMIGLAMTGLGLLRRKLS